MRSLLLIFCLGILLFFINTSCNWQSPEEHTASPLARVGIEYLYSEELIPILEMAKSKDDSLRLQKEFISSWIRNRLVLEKANNYLAEELNEIDQKIKSYRESLLIHTYESQLVMERLDTAISENELTSFYNEHPEMFSLREDIVQLFYIILPNEAPQIDSARILIKQNGELSRKRLADYCFKYADDFMLNDSVWLPFKKIYQRIPIEKDDLYTLCKYKRSGNVQDSSYIYMLKVNNFLPTAELAPLNYVIEDIKKTILLKRKEDVLENLYKQVFEEASSKQQYEIY